MNNPVIYLLVLIASCYGRVAVDEKGLPDVSNVIEELKATKFEPVVQIELATTEIVFIPDSKNKDTEPSEKLEKDSSQAQNCANLTKDIENNTINSEENEICPHTAQAKNDTIAETPKVDNGTALILTPLIEENRLEEARNASRVDAELFLGVKSYSGFITVNETYGSNIFFWYFPIDDATKPVNETPWIIWLQGGPGASSMTGLFDELGPFRVDNSGKLVRNPYSWLRNHSLVFIDNPVGTGYSFTNDVNGYVQDMDTYGSHLFTTVRQLIRVFPELRVAPLFVAGESYAGKYVPALAQQIHQHKDTEQINLQGLIVGNAYIDPAMISHMIRPFYYFGLLEAEQVDTVRPLLEAFQNEIANNRSIEAKQKWTHLITVLLLLTHQKHAYNFLRDELPVGRYSSFLARSDVKRALHVGDIRFTFVNTTTNIKMASDFLSNARPLFEELLDQYRVLAYCGQLDQMLPCVLTSENYRTWRWNGSTEFLEATRYPYIYNNRLSGYHKTGGRLTEVVIRGAGHMAPMDVPAPTQHLVARWTHDQPISQRFGIFDGSFLQDYVRNHSRIHYL